MFDKSHPTTIPDLDLCRHIHVFGIHIFNHVTFMTLCTVTEFNGGNPPACEYCSTKASNRTIIKDVCSGKHSQGSVPPPVEEGSFAPD